MRLAGAGQSFGVRGGGAATPSTTGSAAGGPPPPVGAELVDADGRPRRKRRAYAAYVHFSAEVARAVCHRIAAGESQASICADPQMPSIGSLRAWARQRPAFGKTFARARAMGGRDGRTPVSTWCPIKAHEIVVRVSEGEPLTTIEKDPAMPSARTIFLWRKDHPAFAEDLRVAREVVGERFSDLGWKLAMEATPETAYLTSVRLNKLRWTAGLMAPATHGKMKPVAPELPPPRPEAWHTIVLRSFRVETHPVTGQQRTIGYTPNPETGAVERTSEGEWCRAPDPLASLETAQALSEARRAARELPGDPDDPEGWC